MLTACGSASQIVLTPNIQLDQDVCAISPVTSGALPPSPAHQLELDPAINPTPAFEADVEVVNDYPATPINDGSCASCTFHCDLHRGTLSV